MAAVLVRRLLGDVLRRERQRQGRALRQLARRARVSPGYLSEVERGQKEASSELLAAICTALAVPLSTVLREVSEELAVAEGGVESRPLSAVQRVGDAAGAGSPTALDGSVEASRSRLPDAAAA